MVFKKSLIKEQKNLKVIMIVASESNGVIGNLDGSLPWNSKEDMKWFKTNTSNNTIVMGRKTFDTIGKPLPKRHNIILTRQNLAIDGATVANSIDEVFEACKDNAKVFICGGAEVYRLFEPFADLIYHTEMNLTIGDPSGLPNFSDPANSEDWIEAYRFAGESTRPSCEFVIYARCKF